MVVVVLLLLVAPELRLLAFAVDASGVDLINWDFPGQAAGELRLQAFANVGHKPKRSRCRWISSSSQALQMILCVLDSRNEAGKAWEGE